tara:strand:+ start:432 stop:1550 length:1119 start_codon:yes stop_codon:yes gene_type:complete
MEKTDISMNRLTNRYTTDISNNHLYTVPFIKQQLATKRNTVKFPSKPPLINVDIERPFIIRRPSGEFMEDKVSICSHICKALPLVCKNFNLKMQDHLLLGGEHNIKISPGFQSPMFNDELLTSEEKKEVVLNDPKFGMFSLFKYHLTRGYMNNELKKTNKVYCSHIFSLVFALPIFVFIGQWVLYSALILDFINNNRADICPNNSSFELKLMVLGVTIIYFVRSFFIWDSLTTRIGLKKMARVNSYAVILDTFQEFAFCILVYGANIWVVFIEQDIQDMILNSLAMEFLMQLDNEFEQLYFDNLPGSAEDIYDNVFVSYKENKSLLDDRQKNDKCFRCFSCCVFIPYKLLVITIFIFPLLCALMMVVGPLCK